MLYGPILSRRFGRSLGVNNLRDRVCTYNCVYCQVWGKKLSVERAPHCDPKRLEAELIDFKGEFDYISFVPFGEPTLDENLGECVKVANKFGRTLILTNSSLTFLEEVRRDLMEFHTVSLKVDTVDEGIWKKLNRPHPSLRLDEILDGVKAFAKAYRGNLVTETMLVKGINEDVKDVASFIRELKPRVAFLNVPERPPQERWVREPEDLGKIYETFREYVENLVLVTKRSGVVGGNVKEIAKVHPVPLKIAKEVPEGCFVVEYKGEKFVKC